MDPDNVKYTIEETNSIPPMPFNDALALSGFGKYNIALIILNGIALATTILETMCISFVLPVAQCDLKLDEADKGYISSAAFLGVITSSLLWGFLSDTFGRKKVIVPTLICAFISTFISSFATNFWFFTIFRFLSGFFICGPSSTSMAYLSEFHSEKYRSKAVLGAFVVSGLLTLAMPIAAWLVINLEWEFIVPGISITFRSWRFFLNIVGLANLITGILLAFFPESPKFILLYGNEKRAIQIINQVYKHNGGTQDLNISTLIDENCDASKAIRITKNASIFLLLKLVCNQITPLFSTKYLRVTMITCAMQFGLLTVSIGAYMWFPEISTRVAEYSIKFPEKSLTLCEILSDKEVYTAANSTIDIVNCRNHLELSTFTNIFILEVLYLTGLATASVTVNVFGRLSLMLFYIILCGSSAIALAFIQIPTTSLYVFVILLLCGLVTPHINDVIVEQFPTNLRGMAICFSMMTGRLGGTIGATATGYLMQYYCTYGFLFYGIDLFLCGVLAFFIPNIITKRQHKIADKSLEEHK